MLQSRMGLDLLGGFSPNLGKSRVLFISPGLGLQGSRSCGAAGQGVHGALPGCRFRLQLLVSKIRR